MPLTIDNALVPIVANRANWEKQNITLRIVNPKRTSIHHDLKGNFLHGKFAYGAEGNQASRDTIVTRHLLLAQSIYKHVNGGAPASGIAWRNFWIDNIKAGLQEAFDKSRAARRLIQGCADNEVVLNVTFYITECKAGGPSVEYNPVDFLLTTKGSARADKVADMVERAQGIGRELADRGKLRLRGVLSPIVVLLHEFGHAMQFKRGGKYVKLFDDISNKKDPQRVLESNIEAEKFKKHSTNWSKRNIAGPMYLDDDNIPRNEVAVIREMDGAGDRGPYRTSYFEGQWMLWDPAGKPYIRTPDYTECEDNILAQMRVINPLLASWTNDRTAVTADNAASRFMKFGDRLLYHYKRAETAGAILANLKKYSNFRGKNRRIIAGHMGFVRTDPWGNALRDMMSILTTILYEHTAVKEVLDRNPVMRSKAGVISNRRYKTWKTRTHAPDYKAAVEELLKLAEDAAIVLKKTDNTLNMIRQFKRDKPKRDKLIAFMKREAPFDTIAGDDKENIARLAGAAMAFGGGSPGWSAQAPNKDVWVDINNLCQIASKRTTTYVRGLTNVAAMQQKIADAFTVIQAASNNADITNVHLRKIFTTLSTKKLIICPVAGATNGFIGRKCAGNNQRNETPIIVWDPFSDFIYCAKDGTGGKFHVERADPVLALLHELGHFVQFHEKVAELGDVGAIAYFKTWANFETVLDPDCLRRFEWPMCQHLGVGRRERYYDTNFRAESSMQRRDMRRLVGEEAAKVREQKCEHITTWAKRSGDAGQAVLRACKAMAGPFNRNKPIYPIERCLVGGYYQIRKELCPFVESTRNDLSTMMQGV